MPSSKNPTVAVFTAVYNGNPFLKESISSILTQTYSDFLYYIIDDCSSDESLDTIRSFNDPRIIVLQNKRNLGTALTLNKVLSHIDADIVIRQDHDDVSLPTRIEDQVRFFVHHPHIHLVCSWEHTIDEHNKRIRNAVAFNINYGSLLAKVIVGICPVWHPSLAFRSSAMEAVGFFESEFTRAEDFHVTAKFALARCNAAIIPRYHLLQREHASQQSSKYKDLQKSASVRVQYYVLNSLVPQLDPSNLIAYLNGSYKLALSAPASQLQSLYSSYSRLCNAVTIKYNLTLLEVIAFHAVLSSRCGLGVYLIPFLRYAPVNLSNACFLLLSPQQIPTLRRLLSSNY